MKHDTLIRNLFVVKTGRLFNVMPKEIRDMQGVSLAGCDGIPAVLLIKTKNAVAVPLKLILRKSLEEGMIHEMYKMAYVTPIHKGGVKA